MRRHEGEGRRGLRGVARRAAVLSSIAGAWSVLLSYVLLRGLSRRRAARSRP